MRRPAAVVVTTVLLALGGLLCAACAILMAWAFTLVGQDQASGGAVSPQFVRIMSYFVVGFFLLTGLWQIVTASGLWRLIPWSRVSLLTFSSLLVTFQGLGLLMILVMPFSELVGGRPEVLNTVRIILFVFYAVPLAIGIWWLIYFTRPRIKALFSPGGVLPDEVPRPTSIVVIGWFLATSAATMPLMIWWQWPAVLMGMVLIGWSAVLVNTFWCAFSLYAGVELLRWRISGYYASLALFVFGALNATVFWLMPGSGERAKELMESMRIPCVDVVPAQDPVPPSPELSVAMGLLSAGLPIYFLVTRKAKFLAVAESKQKSALT